MYKILIIAFCLFSSLLFCHEGHHHLDPYIVAEEVTTPPSSPQLDNTAQQWLLWVGGLHFFFLHFPIALLCMTVFSEILFSLFKKTLFDQSARFMLMSAALLSLPTIFTGLIYRYTAIYSGFTSTLLWWHMWFGLATACLILLTAYLRETQEKKLSYYMCLFFSFVLVNITGFIGGTMTFGSSVTVPPI